MNLLYTHVRTVLCDMKVGTRLSVFFGIVHPPSHYFVPLNGRSLFVSSQSSPLLRHVTATPPPHSQVPPHRCLCDLQATTHIQADGLGLQLIHLIAGLLCVCVCVCVVSISGSHSQTLLYFTFTISKGFI